MWLPNSSLTTLVSKITMDRLRQFPEVSNIICSVFVSLDSVYTKVTNHTFGDFVIGKVSKFQDTTRQGFSPGLTSLSQKGLGSKLRIA